MTLSLCATRLPLPAPAIPTACNWLNHQPPPIGLAKPLFGSRDDSPPNHNLHLNGHFSFPRLSIKLLPHQQCLGCSSKFCLVASSSSNSLSSSLRLSSSSRSRAVRASSNWCSDSVCRLFNALLQLGFRFPRHSLWFRVNPTHQLRN